MTVQGMRRLWETFLSAYANEAPPDSRVVTKVSEEVLAAMSERATLAEDEMAAGFDALRATLQEAIERLDPPGTPRSARSDFHI